MDNRFTDDICDKFILELNKNKHVIPIPHASKYNDKHIYSNLFEIKQEVLEGRNRSSCKFRPCNKIESIDDFKKLVNILIFLNNNKNAELYIFELYDKYKKYFYPLTL
jgi:hypothetical protein